MKNIFTNITSARLSNLLIVAFFLTSLSAAPYSYAKPKPSKNNEESNYFSADFEKAPTLINAEHMTLFAKERRVEYKKKVKVVHEDMTLTCDKLKAFYTEDNQIDRIFAIDNVLITRESGVQAKSEHAFFNQKEGTLTLTINPEVTEKGSVVTADKITIYMNEDRSEAEGEVRVKLIEKNDGAVNNTSQKNVKKNAQ